MSERRKFAQGLKQKGMLSGSNRRDSSIQKHISIYSDVDLIKSYQSDPVNYEAFLLDCQSKINKDPLSDMLRFPANDFGVKRLKQESRTIVDTVPKEASKEVSGLFVKECIETYSQNWHVIEKNYEEYGEDYLALPSNGEIEENDLPSQIFELDHDNVFEEEIVSFQKKSITRRGWLYKAPQFGAANLASKAFKRRFCILQQLPDNSYILNYYKDEKISKDPKGAVYLDSCLDAQMTSKGRKFAFELRMQDQNSHLFAGESEKDTNEWIKAINDALHHPVEVQLVGKDNHEQEGKKPTNDFEDMTNLKSNMYPELKKFSKETEQKNFDERKKNRQKLFMVSPDFLPKISEKKVKRPQIPPPATLVKSKHRVMVNCKSINFALRGVVIDGADEPVTNVEPFFVSLCLYDVNIGKKISADFHVDLNHALVHKMIAPNPVNGKMETNTSKPEVAQQNLVDCNWVAHPKKGIFTISKPHPNIFLVVRIEKVLQGSIKSCASPYVRGDGDKHKAALKVLKHAKTACHRLGQYRMPFCWTAKQLFTDEKNLNMNHFDPIYKQEASKLTEEDLLKFLSDFKRQEKLSKLETLDCELQIDTDFVPTDLPNILTSSLIPTKPFCPSQSEPVFEVDEIMNNSTVQHIHLNYINHCYIYPKSLLYDNQNSFAKARNIVVVAEFRDEDSNIPIPNFYKRPVSPNVDIYSSHVNAAVLHHQNKPTFYEEWKLALPLQLHFGHHLVFTFYHVVVDASSKKKDTMHNPVGQAFLPLLTKEGRVATGEHHLPVAVSLQAGYLNHNNLVSKSNLDIKWVDGGKNLFRVGISLVSSIYTDDQHIHNFFEACDRFQSGILNGTDFIKYLKSLLACEFGPLLNFLPTILKKLLFLFTSPGSGPEVENFCMKALVTIVAMCDTNDHNLVLQQYVKYMFTTSACEDYRTKTIHEELITAMTSYLRPTSTDFLTTNKLLLHFSFFLQIVIKSMILHLVDTDKVKLIRTERFPISFQHALQSLVTNTVPHIVKKWKDNYAAIHSANLGLALFVRECFSYMDRGFVFKLVNNYCSNFSSSDSKVLFEMKFEFIREICNHEHYIPLNLPLQHLSKKSKSYYFFSITEEYCKFHFLSGLLLLNVATAMCNTSKIREIAIATLRNLLVKHAYDDRYKSKLQQSRIASLYLPFLRVIIDNVVRFPSDFDSSTELLQRVNSETKSNISRSSDALIGSSSNEQGTSFKAHVGDSSLMATIANPGSTLLNRGIVMSNDGTPSKSFDKYASDSIKEELSITSSTTLVDSEKFDHAESRSLLFCFLYVMDNVNSDAIQGFWNDSHTDEMVGYFQVLLLCIRHFRYTGKKHHFQNIRYGSLAKMSRDISRSFPLRNRSSSSNVYKHLAEPMITRASQMLGDDELKKLSLREANLSTEVGKIVLDVLAEFTKIYKKQLRNRDGDNPLMRKVFDIYLSFLQIPQSEDVLKHVFASLRLFLCKFSNVLFRGTADFCASLIYHSLKCCNSSLASTRAEACALLYLLMRTNYESSVTSGFVRSQLQMIKAVSQLISQGIGIGNSQFQHSLSVINTYAISDKEMQKTPFPTEVKDLTKKIRTVLMATAAMKEHRDDPEMFIDMQCSLARSYSATPELRKTWLESMAETHFQNKNYSEAAMCHVHIAALVAEYLKRKGGVGKGCSAFRAISLNVEKEESSIKEDTGMEDIQYNEDLQISLLQKCAQFLKKAERYELLAPVYRLVIPYYEKRHHYDPLIRVYSTLMQGYQTVVEVNRNGKRLLGTYFRVAFYGQSCFEEEDGKQYIYKEPKLTQLSEISHRLLNLYGKKFGQDNVKLIQESGKVNRNDLELKVAYIQVTYVLPYFDADEKKHRQLYFDQHQNVRNFVFETPFTPGGRARGDIEEQWKRKTILTTSHCFPYITKRIPVSSTRSFEMKPIEVALDEMTSKCNELEQLILAEHVDLKKLQLRLQGSVNVQVNAGPLAYARVFLHEDKVAQHATNTVEILRQMYRRFIILCGKALSINEQLINSNQHAYHQSLYSSYKEMASELSLLMNEQFLYDDDDNESTSFSMVDSETTPQSSRFVAGSVSDSSNV